MLDNSTRGLLGGPVTVDISTIGQECDLAVVIGGDGTLLHSWLMYRRKTDSTNWSK